ncbi:hypothetical protein EVAR_3945_1 [Eumeta japonica]|uniref:Uncharacterized protein n=1 Tax=Eumeta variegata TaxID=151549 RepID=A0A4C1SQV8_EUMVA|nr:hypothetical protein EVAR_3945_1 [Eumeta japonica]
MIHVEGRRSVNGTGWPEALTRSSDHLVGGRHALRRLVRGRHSMTCLLQRLSVYERWACSLSLLLTNSSLLCHVQGKRKACSTIKPFRVLFKTVGRGAASLVREIRIIPAIGEHFPASGAALLEESFRVFSKISAPICLLEQAHTARSSFVKRLKTGDGVKGRLKLKTQNTRALNSSQMGESAREREGIIRTQAGERDSEKMDRSALSKRAQLAELPPRPGASPGMLRRRYSVPEIIMRKYRLAQQRSDSEETGATTAPSRAASPASPSPPRGSCASLCEPPHRFLRRDREVMRKSALLRRLWGRSNCNPCANCCYCSGDLYTSQDCGRETRSLDGSRSELRHLSSSFTSSRHSRDSHMPAGWATPKRQKLESRNHFDGSDEMLRTAMRNSYGRIEETRQDKELSDSTFQSHDHGVSSYVLTSSETPLTDRCNTSDSHGYKINKRSIKEKESPKKSLEYESISTLQTNNDDHSLSETSESYPTTISTAKGTNGSSDNRLFSKNNHIDIRINEKYEEVENNDNNILSNEVSSITPMYELLEVVVSETIDAPPTDANAISSIEKPKKEFLKHTHPALCHKNVNNIDLDQYVSNILVESLNSLTDQIELMNASIGSERKISIVEKEIKVKLQNTGVNTIVHLSPTSNNQIIFGNEELYYNKEDNKDKEVQEEPIRDDDHSVESNNNYTTSAATYRDQSGEVQMDETRNNNFENIMQNETVNKAVLQQIQKLFQDGLEKFDPQLSYAGSVIPEISHIEISNVDVYIDEHGKANLDAACPSEVRTQHIVNNEKPKITICEPTEPLSGISTGSHYKNVDGAILIPRYLAFPKTDSMEVNTSSSDDAEVVGSDCTSLVDSLDDPNSPRSIFLRRTFNSKRSELVRSTIDVLDLLPENAFKPEKQREKSEAFFIRIKDDNCDCEKENIIVADHMPEKIKQRLYRRHRKRELRMECARRKKVKQLKREIEKQRHNDIINSKREIERDCSTIINALIDEVIAKIAEEEFKYMKIKQKTNGQIHKKTNDNFTSVSKRATWKKDIDYMNKAEHLNMKYDIEKERQRKSERSRVRGKMSLQTRPPLTSNECGPKRIYQKSEIHDGNKCIEILEILEYPDTSQSSPDTANSDDNQSQSANKNKKSKIPIPVYERIQTKYRAPPPHKSPTHGRRSPIFSFETDGRSDKILATMLIDALSDSTDGETSVKSHKLTRTPDISARRASVPQQEVRSRSNSLRFRQMFDIIPEEKSSLSIESSNEDVNYNRRVSAPNLTQAVEGNNNETVISHKPPIDSPKLNRRDTQKLSKETKSIGTSPLNDGNESGGSSENTRNKNVMTSPLRKSAATSPIFPNKPEKACGPSSSGKKALSSHGTKAGWLGFYRPNKQILDEEGSKDNPKAAKSDEKSKEEKSTSTQYEYSSRTQSTVRTIESEKMDPIIIVKDKSRVKRESTQSRGVRNKTDERKEKERKKKSERTKSESVDAKERDNKAVRQNDGTARPLSDPPGRDVIIRKTDKKRIQMISLEKSEEETVHPRTVRLSNALDDNGGVSSTDSDDSGKSLLCSLAPKWLAGGRQKRQVRKKPSQEQVNQQNPAGNLE